MVFYFLLPMTESAYKIIGFIMSLRYVQITLLYSIYRFLLFSATLSAFIHQLAHFLLSWSIDIFTFFSFVCVCVGVCACASRSLRLMLGIFLNFFSTLAFVEYLPTAVIYKTGYQDYVNN